MCSLLPRDGLHASLGRSGPSPWQVTLGRESTAGGRSRTGSAATSTEWREINPGLTREAESTAAQTLA